MFKEVALVSYGAFSDIFASWERIGVFSYLLPFLLIFALVFGILTKVKLFKENKAINAIIALAVSLISLQSPLIPQFFSAILPRIGIGLIIILAVLILLGLFVDPDSNVSTYGLLGVGGIVLITILIQTAKSVGLPYGDWISSNWTIILGIIIFLVLVIIVVGSAGPKPRRPPPYQGILFKENY